VSLIRELEVGSFLLSNTDMFDWEIDSSFGGKFGCNFISLDVILLPQHLFQHLLTKFYSN
jgi:hypothetical protein